MQTMKKTLAVLVGLLFAVSLLNPVHARKCHDHNKYVVKVMMTQGANDTTDSTTTDMMVKAISMFFCSFML
jgi:hypothetical protein